jgi:hypothetical protein
MRFILHQGIIKEFDNYAKSMKDIEIRDDVEIEEELTLVAPIKTDFPCGEEIFVIVDKMPEYIGGKEAEKNYLSVKSSDIKGIVYVQFIIINVAHYDKMSVFAFSMASFEISFPLSIFAISTIRSSSFNF